MGYDEAVFAEANSKKLSWSVRYDLIREQFPSVERLRWEKAFDDVELLGRVLRDILKIDQAPQGRSGPRPTLDYEKAQKRLAQFLGNDYTVLPFHEALRVLAGDRSIRSLATKTGLDRNLIHRLLSQQIAPDAYIITEVANAFDKQPSYFLEYRVNVVLAALSDQMMSAPEMTIDLYRRIIGQGKR